MRMRLSRFSRLAALALPFVMGCDEDNVFGIGVGDRERFAASLTGGGVRPTPVATTVTATAELTLKEPDIGTTGRTLAYVLTASGLTSATAAHIHLGGAAIANGPVLATLYTNPTDTTITEARLASGSLAASGIQGGVTLDSLAKLMSSGAAYVDIHTKSNPEGLVRGQVARAGEQPPLDRFAASALSGANERPTPVVSTASGNASFELLANGSIRYTLTVTGVTGATMAHIHTAVPDSAGPIAVTLFTTSVPTGSVSGTLANGTFAESAIEIPGISMDSLLSLMRRGRTYVNVHTTAHPTGEIRAQIEPVTVLP